MLAKGLEKTRLETVQYKLRCFLLRLVGCKPYISGYSVKERYNIGDRVERIGTVQSILFCGRWTFNQDPNMQPIPHYQIWVK